MKISNPFKRSVKVVEVQPQEPEPTNECTIVLHIKDGQLDVQVDWTDDLNMKYVGSLVGTIATGEIVGPVLQEVADNLKARGREEELETVHEVVRFRVAKHRDAALEEAGRSRPVVSPHEAIRRQLTMFQPQQG